MNALTYLCRFSPVPPAVKTKPSNDLSAYPTYMQAGREYLGGTGGGHRMSVVEKVSFVPAVERKHGKCGKKKPSPFSRPACLFPQFFTLLCNFMEYDSQLGNFNTDRKKRKRLSSKYILCSSGSNLISVKRKNKGTPVFWNEASWYFWRGPF